MLPLNYFLFLQIILFLFITPGTPRIVIISYSMNYGFQKCIWTALGDVTANFIQATLVIFVIGSFFSDNSNLLNIFKWIGVVYILYLAYDLYNSIPKDINSNNVSSKSFFSFFKDGFLAALNHIKQKQFYLLMVDHIFNDEFYSTIFKSKINNTKCYLAISKSLSSMHDHNDATKVKITENKITNIGKSINEADGFDSGFFILHSEAFNDVKNLSEKKFITLSDVMQVLIQEQKLYFIEVVADSWLDIDTKIDFSNAKNFLLNSSGSKNNNGPISTYFNRRISKWITSKLVYYPITPNQISVITFLITVIASLIIVKQDYFFLVLGALLAQLSSILDGCDGEIARLKLLASKYGGWFDQVLDRYSDLFIITGLTFHTYFLHNTLVVFIIGFIAVGGKIILSYTAQVYDSVISKRSNFRMGRDVTIFIILIGAIMNIPYITLIILAVITNVEVCRRLWRLQNKIDC